MTDRPLSLVPLDRARTLHLLGIGGSGMAPLATALLDMGHEVSGTDLVESEAIDALRARGATVHIGHDGSNVPRGADAVVVSTAVPADNIEVSAAHSAGIAVVHRTEVLVRMAQLRRTIAIAGTHGKTTTTAMLAEVFVHAGLDPSYLVGGRLGGDAGGARWGSGDVFVVEADESDGSGFAIPHAIGVVTNVEPDHLEHHGTFARLSAAFAGFLDASGEAAWVCIDDAGAAALTTTSAVHSWGLDPRADVRAVDVRSDRWSSSFGVVIDGVDHGRVELPLPGLHNVRNAVGALALAHHLGVAPTVAADALARFSGVARRFERRGSANGVEFVDDYAHLPTEVAAAVAAARAGGWERVVVVHQPHRYSRTEALAAGFADAFVDADLIVVTDVYAAGERPRPGVTGAAVVDGVRAAHPDAEVVYVADRDALARSVAELLRAGDLCLSVGAGDVTHLADEIRALPGWS